MATGRSVLLHERKAVRWRHVMQPEHRGQIPSWVAPARQQCSTFPLVQYTPSVVVMRMRRYYAIGRGPAAVHVQQPYSLLLFTEVDIQNARPSKILTTERLVFFGDDYEIESGQGNDTASVQRQNARPSKVLTTLFPATIKRWRAAKT